MPGESTTTHADTLLIVPQPHSALLTYDTRSNANAPGMIYAYSRGVNSIVGSVVGTLDGCPVGTLTGWLVGLIVGCMDGTLDGCIDG